VEFLVLAEDTLDTLGDDPIARQNAANQLIFVLLVEPAEHWTLLNNLEDQIAVEQHQMRVYIHGQPKAKQCERLVTLWARWVDTKGMLCL